MPHKVCGTGELTDENGADWCFHIVQVRVYQLERQIYAPVCSYSTFDYVRLAHAAAQ